MVEGLDIGIEVNSVVLTEKTAPTATLNAFQQVIAAEQESQNAMLQAQREATRTRGKAHADAAHLLSEAESYRKRVISDVAAENAYFQRILVEFRANPATVLFALYTDTLATVLDQATDKYIIHTNDKGRQEVRLQINPEPPKPTPTPDATREKDE
jgi:regulator of protease activity HflC (stomatin/prohibitin superfamily)